VHIGLDLDGTTVEFIDQFFHRYVEWFGLQPVWSHTGEWENLVTATHFETMPEALEWADRASVYEDLAWVPGAPAFIERALAGGDRVTFLTARKSAAAQAQTVCWSRLGPFGSSRPSPGLRMGLARKSDVACDIYFDDAPHIVDELVSAGKEVVVFDRPWNQPRDLKSPTNLYARVHTWPEATSLIFGEKAVAA
jgi:hypothetical protein